MFVLDDRAKLDRRYFRERTIAFILSLNRRLKKKKEGRWGFGFCWFLFLRSPAPAEREWSFCRDSLLLFLSNSKQGQLISFFFVSVKLEREIYLWILKLCIYNQIRGGGGFGGSPSVLLFCQIRRKSPNRSSNSLAHRRPRLLFPVRTSLWDW